MNYLLAKVKRKHQLFRVLATDNEVYELPDTLDKSIAYDPQTLLEDEEWYKLADFSRSAYAFDFISDDFDSVNYNQISNDDTTKIAYLCTVQGVNYFFQVISSSMLIRKKWFSLDELSIETDKPIITINKEADAIYNKTNDILYFRKLSTANLVFKGIDQLYREATDSETETFLNNDFIKLKEGFNADSVKIPNRKRIAMVTDTLNRFTQQEKMDIFIYIQDYCAVPYQNDQFEIQSEDDLKLVLWGIEQRFYTTRLGGEKRIANSVIPIT